MFLTTLLINTKPGVWFLDGILVADICFDCNGTAFWILRW